MHLATQRWRTGSKRKINARLHAMYVFNDRASRGYVPWERHAEVFVHLRSNTQSYRLK